MSAELVPTNLTNDHTIGVLEERVRCLQLIDNLIEYHRYNVRFVDLLKELRKRVKSGGTNGGLLNGRLAKLSNN